MSDELQAAAEPDETTDATIRLERALERIAAGAHTGRSDAIPVGAIGARLDALIARLRAALDEHPGEE